MNDLAKLIVVAILCVLKLVITGICLAIGFKLGYMIIDKADQNIKKRALNKVQTAA